MTDAEFDALSDEQAWAATFDERTISALALTDALSGDHSHELSTDLRAAVRAAFTEDELAELLLVIGQANLNNRVGNGAKQILGPDDDPGRSQRRSPTA